MQSTTLDDIRMFLNNNGWSFNGAKSNQTFNYFDYPIDYNFISWEKSYYSNENIILYNSKGKPNIVIYQSNYSCFNDLLKFFSSTKGETSIYENMLVTIFKENSITIEFREYKNDYSSRQYSILLYNSTALNHEIETSKHQKEAREKEAADREEARQKEAIEKEETRQKEAAEREEARLKEVEERRKKYEKNLADGDNLFFLKNYEKAKLNYLAAKNIENNDFVQAKIELCAKLICDQIISKGDIFFEANQYENALFEYNKAKECSKLSIVLKEKINLTEKKILDSKIKILQNKADQYFSEKKYDLSLDNYNSILLIDKLNTYAVERIKRIQEIKYFLTRRLTTVFSYSNTNKIDLLNFQNLLLDDLKLRIVKNESGFLNLNYVISFDTLGKNHSKFNNITTSLTGYKNDVIKIASNGVLKPSKEGSYFLASKENLFFNVKWNTTKNVYKSNSKGIFQKEYPVQNLNFVETFINIQPFKYGKYTFEIKNIEVNGNLFSNINLVKYKTVGPSAALYSMLIPGMGTLKVSYGKKGWGRFSCFILSSGISIGSKLYSDKQYKSYLVATNQNDIDTYYNNANLSYKCALISLGISGSLYLYDIIWVITKGAINIKESKSLRKQLKQGPVQIQNQSISWQ